RASVHAVPAVWDSAPFAVPRDPPQVYSPEPAWVFPRPAGPTPRAKGSFALRFREILRGPLRWQSSQPNSRVAFRLPGIWTCPCAPCAQPARRAGQGLPKARHHPQRSTRDWSGAATCEWRVRELLAVLRPRERAGALLEAAAPVVAAGAAARRFFLPARAWTGAVRREAVLQVAAPAVLPPVPIWRHAANRPSSFPARHSRLPVPCAFRRRRQSA